MVFKTLISSVMTMLPISAEKAEPERPLTVIAVISGPASLVMPMATSWITSSSTQFAEFRPALKGQDQTRTECR